MKSKPWEIGPFIRTFKIFLVSQNSTQPLHLKSETLQNISDFYMYAFSRLLILIKQKLKRKMLKNEAISNQAK
jgi:hypothetical protein